MGRVTERRQKEKQRKEKNRGAEKTCQCTIPRHSGKPSEDKDKDMKKARQKRKGATASPSIKNCSCLTCNRIVQFTDQVPITCKNPVGGHTPDIG